MSKKVCITGTGTLSAIEGDCEVSLRYSGRKSNPSQRADRGNLFRLACQNRLKSMAKFFHVPTDSPYFSPLNKTSLFPGFSTSRETNNFQKNSRESQDPENPRDSWGSENFREIFLGIFLELDYFAIFSDFQHF